MSAAAATTAAKEPAAAAAEPAAAPAAETPAAEAPAAEKAENTRPVVKESFEELELEFTDSRLEKITLDTVVCCAALSLLHTPLLFGNNGAAVANRLFCVWSRTAWTRSRTSRRARCSVSRAAQRWRSQTAIPSQCLQLTTHRTSLLFLTICVRLFFPSAETDTETEGENSEDSFSETVLRCYREGLHRERAHTDTWAWG